LGSWFLINIEVARRRPLLFVVKHLVYTQVLSWGQIHTIRSGEMTKHVKMMVVSVAVAVLLALGVSVAAPDLDVNANPAGMEIAGRSSGGAA
jgi:hypothetical protein